MKKPYYIASCVFTSKYPELGKVIQRYIHERYGLPIWELILSDERFAHPDYYGETAIVQNCWWAKERTEEQDAVRELLRKMNCSLRELPENRESTDFCSVSVYRTAPKRNLELAPHRFVENAAGKFISHTKEEQTALMHRLTGQFRKNPRMGSNRWIPASCRSFFRYASGM